jgi:predicted lipoprotein with Yx(FWY)xxD motif
MKKEYTIVVIVAILVFGVLGYLGRSEIKSLLGIKSTPSLAGSNTKPGDMPTLPPANPPANNVYGTKTDVNQGVYLTDFAGMSLYTFDNDTNGTSNCYSDCATTWPPYTSGAADEGNLPPNITVVTRTDGSTQFVWSGMPLYYYSGDKNIGEINGDGIEGVWHLVKP